MKTFSVVAGLYKILARYPAISAGLANIAVAMAATFGLHWTANQVVSAVTFMAAVTALLVHAGVIPVTKAANVKAGIKPTVPNVVHVVKPEAK